MIPASIVTGGWSATRAMTGVEVTPPTSSTFEQAESNNNKMRMSVLLSFIRSNRRSYYGMIVGGVGVDVGGNVAVGVDVTVGDKEGVSVIRGVRVGRGVGVSVGVLVGVRLGASTRVGVTKASTGYSSCMALYQVRPLVNANSVKRAPL